MKSYLLNKRKRLRVQQARADIIHSNRKIKEIFDPEKLTFSINSEHKRAWKSPGSSFLPYSLPSLWKIRKRLSQLSPLLIMQRDNIHARGPTTRAWSSANIWRQDGAICSKNRKIVPYHGSAWISRLTVSVPDYGSWLTWWWQTFCNQASRMWSWFRYFHLNLRQGKFASSVT